MKFKQGISTWLWETKNGLELAPPIKEVVYNFDEEMIYCLFEIEESLNSSFWAEINKEFLNSSLELNQFKVH